MRVSPLDIRKQEFTRTFRGYEIEEVQAFLQMISREWEEMRDEQRRLEEQLRGMEDKIRHYERVEEALQEALQTARDSSRKTVQNAEERARNIIKSAEAKASQIEGEAVSHREKLRQENSRLINRQHEIVARLRAFLSSEIEMLERYEGNQLVGSRSAEVERDTSRSSSQRRPESAPATPSQGPDPGPAATAHYDDEQEDDEVDLDQPAIDRGGTFNVRPLVNQPIADPEWEPDESDDTRVDDSVEVDDADADDPLPQGAEGEKTKARQATEEIEKIRRILNDLD